MYANLLKLVKAWKAHEKIWNKIYGSWKGEEEWVKAKEAYRKLNKSNLKKKEYYL